jgi:hypothetical protein
MYIADSPLRGVNITMHKFLLLLLFTVAFTSYGQQGKFNPFRLIVLQPDTAIIDPSLYGDIDSVRSTYIRRYYSSVKQMEDMLNFNNYPSEKTKEYEAYKEKIRKNLPLVKAKEEEVKKFKYFQTLSYYSTEVYNFYFNECRLYRLFYGYPYGNGKTSPIAANYLPIFPSGQPDYFNQKDGR